MITWHQVAPPFRSHRKAEVAARKVFGDSGWRIVGRGSRWIIQIPKQTTGLDVDELVGHVAGAAGIRTIVFDEDGPHEVNPQEAVRRIMSTGKEPSDG